MHNNYFMYFQVLHSNPFEGEAWELTHFDPPA